MCVYVVMVLCMFWYIKLSLASKHVCSSFFFLSAILFRPGITELSFHGYNITHKGGNIDGIINPSSRALSRYSEDTMDGTFQQRFFFLTETEKKK